MTRTIATHPRAVVLALIAAGLMLGLIAGSTVLSPKAASADGGTGVENVVVGNVTVDHEFKKRSSKKSVQIWGSGFEAGQGVILMINDGPGTPSDITAFTTNRVRESGLIVANDNGAWSTVWKLGRFTRSRSGIGPGDGDVERMRTLSVVDPTTFEVITSTPLAFCRVTDRAKAQAAADEIAADLAAVEAASTEFAGLTKPAEASDAVWALIPRALEARAATLSAEVEAAEGAIVVAKHCPA